MKEIFAKPFLKWAGGKSGLLDVFENYYPLGLKNGDVDTYIEPFVGGGAVLFDVLQKYKISKAYINDINEDLINCYRCIKSDVTHVVGILTKLQNKYYSTEDRDAFYYSIRYSYNEKKLKKEPDFQRCRDFIFLNKTCFNGLYRVNKKGEFNVPQGRYKNPLICDKDNLILCSELLQNVEISVGEYKSLLDRVGSNTFTYLDPPYKPLIKNNSFVQYDKNGFTDEDQIALSKMVGDINKKGGFFMLSNSDPKNVNPNDNFFDELYSDYNMNIVFAKRMINCKANKRGDITEILVTNY